jgi:hypothetical protein
VRIQRFAEKIDERVQGGKGKELIKKVGFKLF